MPSFTWNEILPVIISIILIIAIAVLKKYSDTVTAIAATMPLNIPLGLWVFASGEQKDSTDLSKFAEAVLINMFPTMLFIAAVWIVLRYGGSLLVAIIVGYLIWALSLGLLYLIRHYLGQ